MKPAALWGRRGLHCVVASSSCGSGRLRHTPSTGKFGTGWGGQQASLRDGGVRGGRGGCASSGAAITVRVCRGQGELLGRGRSPPCSQDGPALSAGSGEMLGASAGAVHALPSRALPLRSGAGGAVQPIGCAARGRSDGEAGVGGDALRGRRRREGPGAVAVRQPVAGRQAAADAGSSAGLLCSARRRTSRARGGCSRADRGPPGGGGDGAARGDAALGCELDDEGRGRAVRAHVHSCGSLAPGAAVGGGVCGRAVVRTPTLAAHPFRRTGTRRRVASPEPGASTHEFA